MQSVTAIVVLFLFIRLLGKKQLSQLTYFEYIIGVAMGSVAAFGALETKGKWWHALIALAVWFLIAVGKEYIEMHSNKARDLLSGKGTVLIKDGKLLEDNMKKARYNIDNLLKQLRNKNVFQVADVEFAVLETSGDLSVLLKEENRPVTPKMLGNRMPNLREPQTVIMDGKMLYEPLATIGLSPGWLTAELEKQGVALENVFLAQVDGKGQLNIDLYDDQIQVPEPNTLEMLMAVLKKCEADLELFALSTKQEEAKQMYASCADKMKQVRGHLEPVLRS